MNDEVAKILDQALDSVWQGKTSPAEWVEKYPQYGEELMSLFDTATVLRGLEIPEASREFRIHSRSRILRYISIKQAAAEAAVKRPVKAKPAKRSVPMFRRTVMSFAMVATLLVALMGTGTVYAASDSIPGDMLYPVKITVEDVRLAVSNDQQDARLYVQFTGERVEEIEKLVSKGRVELIPVATARLEDQVRGAIEILPQASAQGLPEEDQNTLLEALNQNTLVLERVLESAPAPAVPGLQRAIQASQDGKDQVEKLLPSLQKNPTQKPGPLVQSTRKPLNPETVKPRRVTPTPRPTKTPEGATSSLGGSIYPANESPPVPTKTKVVTQDGGTVTDLEKPTRVP